MAHRCPAPRCTVQVSSRQYACRAHWFTIPRPLRDELWIAYREHGPLSKQHTAAMTACDDFLRSAV